MTLIVRGPGEGEDRYGTDRLPCNVGGCDRSPAAVLEAEGETVMKGLRLCAGHARQALHQLADVMLDGVAP